MVAFTLPKDTVLPNLTATLTQDTGAAINLTGATVKFQMRLPGIATLKVDRSATITNATAGQVSFTWDDADTDVPGLYIGWFKATYGVDQILYAPNPPFVVEIGRGAG